MAAWQVEELRAIAETLKQHAEREQDSSINQVLVKLQKAAMEFGRAWSGSSVGYHATVYYENFEVPPPDAHFSSEWGAQAPSFEPGTTGQWREYRSEDVLAAIYRMAGDPNLSDIERQAVEARSAIGGAKNSANSILSVYLSQRDDTYLTEVRERVANSEPLTLRTAIAGQLPKTASSRDSRAASGGITHAPHQQVLAQVVAIRSAFQTCGALATLLDHATDHIERAASRGFSMRSRQGGSVFIGHGRSPMWRELKDFISDRLHLPRDEFNRVAVAGTTNIERLIQMLDAAGIAFIILTAEDERTDGAMLARQNAVHEAGLFQGRLGFSRAIVMLEEGCDQFSNIDGLGQIRFPAANIAASFEEVRRVLEREGFLGS